MNSFSEPAVGQSEAERTRRFEVVHGVGAAL
jgi:hypothetical protein